MRRSGWVVAVALGCLATLIFACYGPVLFQARQFAYRDAGHFYYPLYERVQREWEAGRIPLWEPAENSGAPLLGNPIAAVVYPGKIIYSALTYPWAARVYVLAHSVLACVAMAALLRRWSISPVGSALGALAYGFGAPVLFQSCNVVFLVGAAWAPLGFRAADGWLRLGRWWGLGELALVLAMQFLGGDAEAAYVTALGAAGYAVVLALARPSSPEPRRRSVVEVAVILALGVLSPSIAAGAGRRFPTQAFLLAAWGTAFLVLLRRGRGGSVLHPMLLGLAGSGALALSLAAVQLLPALEFAAHSERADEEGPHDIYPYSLHPLRIVEYAWPGVFGTTPGVNRSWLPILPPTHDHRTWVPSLYLGGLSLVLALSAAGTRSGEPWRTWLTGLVVVGLLASLGAFGSPLFWARCVPGWSRWLGPPEDPAVLGIRTDGRPRDGVGGPYWFLAATLPGFRTFRYPSKLLTFVSLGLAGLAGVGWDDLSRDRSRRAAILAAGLSVPTLIALVAASAWRERIAEAMAARAALALSAFGPLDVRGAMVAVQSALVHGGTALAFSLVLVLLAARRPATAGLAAIIALTLDLSIANGGLVWTAPQSAFEGVPRVLAAIRRAEKAHPAPGPFRVHRLSFWSPLVWLTESSPRRIEETLRWEHETLRPNFNLPLGISMTFTPGTTYLGDYGSFFDAFPIRPDAEAARALNVAPGASLIYYPRRAFDLWGARYFILPARPAWNSRVRGFASFLDQTESIDPDPAFFEGPEGAARRQRWLREDDVQVVLNLAAFPRAWVVHEARFVENSSSDRQRSILGALLYQDDALWHEAGRPVHDLRRLAFVEADPESRRAVARALAGSHDTGPPEAVEFVRDEPRRVELAVAPRTPGLVVLADVYYPGWRLTIDGQPAEIVRVNRMMRGAVVGAGRHQLVYTYEPLSFRAGLMASLAGLIALAGLAAWSIRRPRLDLPPLDEAPGRD